MTDLSTREWLEPDGLGGFASGTASGIRTRRYHALLLAARTPPTGRFVLVNGFDAWVESPSGRSAVSTQAYAGGVTDPDGASRIESFAPDPWPRWVYRLPDGTRVSCEVFVPKGRSAAAVAWQRLAGSGPAALEVRPFLSGRDHHALHHENPGFRFAAESLSNGSLRFRPYDGVPAVLMRANGHYAPRPDWYRRFGYAEERARGLDSLEDLAAPGVFRFDLAAGPAVWLMAAEGSEGALDGESPERTLDRLREAERSRRAAFPARLERSAEAYAVRRGDGKTIVAGYPWFTDWGRDTFIGLRGLCLATGRLAEAGAILSGWAGAVSQGMMPNDFPDAERPAEFNSVDASLWYVVAVHDYLQALGAASGSGEPPRTLRGAVETIVSGYSRGTRYGIRADADGLLAAGQDGVALTWMDAKVGDRVVTPRIGKPVEVQALWINALRIAASFAPHWTPLHERAVASFARRFWNADGGCLYDVVDAGHVPGANDATFRPNQIFAAGGLPFPILEGARARSVVDAVEARLSTPLGLRSLSPDDPSYRPRYDGGPADRDGAYHQGTVWPFLQGAFVDAWVRVRGGTAAAKAEARTRFLEPLRAHLDEAGLGHVSEIADGDPPHTPRGCPFQAWSLGEMIRIERIFLASGRAASDPRPNVPAVGA